MTIFSYSTIRYFSWFLVILLLHWTGTLTIITLFIPSVLLIWANYYFQKTNQEKEFKNKLIDGLWLPILVGTMVFVLVEYTFS